MATLLNTRPSLQAQELNKVLDENKLDYINCPAINIKQVSFSQQKPLQSGYAFFISVNAVIHFMAQVQSGEDFFKQTTVYAIGKATQEQLAKYNIKAITPFLPFNSNSVLKLLPNSLKNISCLVIKGQNGLKDLTAGLMAKKATVTEIICYKRLANPFCSKAWGRFKQLQKGVILITSVEIINSIILKTPTKEMDTLLKMRAIVFSERIQIKILELGWQGCVYLTKEQNNMAIIKILKKIRTQNDL
jgi:uroporphyrinogen-III synthase